MEKTGSYDGINLTNKNSLPHLPYLPYLPYLPLLPLLGVRVVRVVRVVGRKGTYCTFMLIPEPGGLGFRGRAGQVTRFPGHPPPPHGGDEL